MHHSTVPTTSATAYPYGAKAAVTPHATASANDQRCGTMSRTSNNIARAAREASIDRKYLYTLLAKHGLSGNDDS